MRSGACSRSSSRSSTRRRRSSSCTSELEHGARSRRPRLGGRLRRRRLDRRLVSRARAPPRGAPQRPRRSSAQELRQGGRARRGDRGRGRRRRSSRWTRICRTTRPRSRTCSRSSTTASTSSRAGSATATIRSSRRFVSRIYNTATRLATGVKLHDMNCGLKAYRAEVFEHVRLYGERHRFVPVLAHHLGFSVAELPVNHRARANGHSRFGIERYLRAPFDLLTIVFMGRYRHRPLHLFGGRRRDRVDRRRRHPRLPHRRSRSAVRGSAAGRCSCSACCSSSSASSSSRSG